MRPGQCAGPEQILPGTIGPSFVKLIGPRLKNWAMLGRRAGEELPCVGSPAVQWDVAAGLGMVGWGWVAKDKVTRMRMGGQGQGDRDGDEWQGTSCSPHPIACPTVLGWGDVGFAAW